MEWLAGTIMLLSGWRRLLVAFIAGVVAVAALPPVDFFAAMFVSFPLLVWLLDGASGNPDRGWLGRSWPAFGIGWSFGFGYFVAGLWWLGGALLVEADAFAWAIPLAVLGLPAFLAIFFGFGTLCARLLWSDGFGRLAALALGLTLAEALRGMVFTGFPWNTLGYGAMPIPLLMQSAHLVGLLGVTALSIVVFASPALLASRRGRLPGLIVAAAIAAGHVGYGFVTLRDAESAPALVDGGTTTVRLVQPSIPQTAKWEPDEREDILNRHLALTSAPAESDAPAPDIIVWAETAIPYILTEQPDVLRRIADALQPGQRLAAGIIRMEDGRAGEAARYYNSITVIDDSGQITAAADKVHLVPFGEYLPFEDWLSTLGLSAVAQNAGGFSAGSGRQSLDLAPGVSAHPLICYEAIFPIDIGLTDAAAAAPAAFLLNVTNDAWYGRTPGPYQHLRQAQLRAAEIRTPLVRAANNGLSVVTDGYGRIIDGLALDTIGHVDIVIPPRPVSEWDNLQRRMNLWLIIGMLLLLSSFSRIGLLRR
jgi:apolipoprotein N-acyltransferase